VATQSYGMDIQMISVQSNPLAFRTGCSQSVVMHTYTYITGLAHRFRGGSLHSCPQRSEGVSALEGFAMTPKANRVTWLRRTVLPQGSQGPAGGCPPARPHLPELGAANARSDFRGSTRPRCPAGDRACAPASVAAARQRFLTPSSGAVRGAPSRGGRSHPPARAP